MVPFLFLLFSLVLSIIINSLYIDSVLTIFQIMSQLALISNRIALALFIYFVLDLIFIHRNLKFREIMNKLFFIYIIWLLGMLFGRFFHTNPQLAYYFNFKSFIPIWIHHLTNPLVRYYLLGNIIVFIPFGIFLRYHKNLILSTTYFILIICLLETIQALTHLGYFDIDDLILNGIGGLFGIIVMDLYKTFFN